MWASIKRTYSRIRFIFGILRPRFPINMNTNGTAPSYGRHVRLFPCWRCHRTFNRSALETHVRICERMSKKREVFDSSLQRRTAEGDALKQSLKAKDAMPSTSKGKSPVGVCRPQKANETPTTARRANAGGDTQRSVASCPPVRPEAVATPRAAPAAAPVAAPAAAPVTAPSLDTVAAPSPAPVAEPIPAPAAEPIPALVAEPIPAPAAAPVAAPSLDTVAAPSPVPAAEPIPMEAQASAPAPAAQVAAPAAAPAAANNPATAPGAARNRRNRQLHTAIRALQLCPHCERSFNVRSYENHVKWCEKSTTSVPFVTYCNKEVNAAETANARQRMEARMRYKPPTPKTKQTL